MFFAKSSVSTLTLGGLPRPGGFLNWSASVVNVKVLYLDLRPTNQIVALNTPDWLTQPPTPHIQNHGGNAEH